MQVLRNESKSVNCKLFIVSLTCYFWYGFLDFGKAQSTLKLGPMTHIFQVDNLKLCHAYHQRLNSDRAAAGLCVDTPWGGDVRRGRRTQATWQQRFWGGKCGDGNGTAGWGLS